jgi:hypothetical protein
VKREGWKDAARSSTDFLPFKGRVRVGMGLLCQRVDPIPLLTSPLKGEEQIGGKITGDILGTGNVAQSS